MLKSEEELFLRRTKKSKNFNQKARDIIPGTTSHAGSRYYKPYLISTDRGKGSHIWDVDGNEYVDYWIGHGVNFLGHAHPKIVSAVEGQIEKGSQLGTSTPLELELAKQIIKMVPSVEMVRFCNSGTEANFSAGRLARTISRKKKIAKFEGHYHGWFDYVSIGGRPPFNVPSSGGIPEESIENTVLLPYNDLEGTVKVIKEQEKELACVYVEPSPHFSIPPVKGFLEGLREITEDKGILLIFDEVVTGFRFAPGGASEYFGVIPDIECYGKIVGGGLPVGAVAGKKDIMAFFNDPTITRPRNETAYHGGTFSGNPLVMAAGLASLKELEDGSLNNCANRFGDNLRQGLEEIFSKNKIEVSVMGICSLTQTYFVKGRPKDIVSSGFGTEAAQKLLDFKIGLINRGIYCYPPSGLYNSAVHTKDDLNETLEAAEKVARLLR